MVRLDQTQAARLKAEPTAAAEAKAQASPKTTNRDRAVSLDFGDLPHTAESVSSSE